MMKKKPTKTPTTQRSHNAKRSHSSKDVAQKPADDPWLYFLDHIDQYAVDTGIEDLSLNHDHYLYGVPK